ncbi:hypothetical protein [Virgibacillus dakarensis]|uniref:hypothetical protein n=1 Tax=Virgibacillus dakarensis TaxID=1917889 RepID=UPI000B43640F|nr:hypothetical protein [Virgibacillus dakarensis]
MIQTNRKVLREWVEIIDGKEVPCKEVENIVAGKKVTVITKGEPDIDTWAKKVKQVYEDMEAGRYKEEAEKRC